MARQLSQPTAQKHPSKCVDPSVKPAGTGEAKRERLAWPVLPWLSRAERSQRHDHLDDTMPMFGLF